MEENWLSFKFVDQVSSYIESPKWLRYKNATINPKNINDRCFQYAFVPTQTKKK